jgi:hypothetical protein
MLTREVYDEFNKEYKPLKEHFSISKKKVEEETKIIYPSKMFKGASRAQDSLFWCFLYLWKPKLYQTEIMNATFTNEYNLKCKVIHQLEKFSKTKEKEIRNVGYRNIRLTKLNGYDPRLSITELIAECSGVSPIRIQGFNSLLCYFDIKTPCVGVVDYHDVNVGIPLGNRILPNRTQQFYHENTIFLRRKSKKWYLTEKDDKPRCYMSSLNVTLPSMPKLKKEDLQKWSNEKKTKQELYNQAQMWFNYRTSILRDAFDK